MPKPAVLIVARGFPPFIRSLGGAMRVLKLAEFLRNEGFSTHVLAGCGAQYGDFGYGDLLRQLDVTYVPDPMLRLVAGNTGESPATQVSLVTLLLNQLKRLIREVVLNLSVPDTGAFALLALFKTASRLIKDKQINAIITSGPPHSDHLVGLRLKRHYPDLRWIVDYRDSWNGTALFRKSFPLAQKLNRALEQRVLTGCDAITVISEPMIDKILAITRGGVARHKISLVMNGFDPSPEMQATAWRNDRGPLRIGYFGAIDDRPASYRNPGLLFQVALERGMDVRFDFYGPARIGPGWQKALGDRLKLHGNLSHSEAIARMRTCDVLMLLHTQDEGADEVLTGKVFEYIASGRPILAIGPLSMAVSGLLAADGIDRTTENRPAALKHALEDFARAKSAEQLGERDRAEMARYSRADQYQRFVALLLGEDVRLETHDTRAVKGSARANSL